MSAVLSTIIPTHRRHQQVKALVSSLQKQLFYTDQPDLNNEIIVVSNLPDPKLKAWIESLKQNNIRYFHSGSLGVNSARNLGLRMAKGKILNFLDDDCQVRDPHYLARVYRLHQKHPELSGIGGYYQLPSNPKLITSVYHHNADHWLRTNTTSAGYALQMVGGNCSYKREVFANRFKFNENIVFGGAESELNSRLSLEGHKFKLFDELNIVHNCQLSSYSFLKKAYKQGQGCKLEQKSSSDSDVQQRNIEMGALKLKLFSFFLNLYSLFYRLGYRKSQQLPHLKNSPLTLVRLAYLELTSEPIIKGHWHNEKAYHLTPYPHLRAKPLYHWLKAHKWIPLWFSARPYHFVKKHAWRVGHSFWQAGHKTFHFLKAHLWRIWWFLTRPFYLLLHKPFHLMKKHAWRVGHNIWRAGHKTFHFLKAHLWQIWWFLTRPFYLLLHKPFHLLKKHTWRVGHSFWQVGHKTFHLLKKNIWRLAYALNWLVNTTYHGFKIHIAHPVWKFNHLIFHSLKKHLWRVGWLISRPFYIVVHKPFHLLKKNIWRLGFALNWLFVKLYHGSRIYLLHPVWRFNHQLYHGLRKNSWKLIYVFRMAFIRVKYSLLGNLWRIPHFFKLAYLKVYYFFKGHAWRVVWLARQPYHWLRLVLWRIPFIFPFSILTKIYFIIEFQISKLSWGRKVFGKYSSDDIKRIKAAKA